MLTIVGQGLVGTLAGLEAEGRGLDFRIVDQGSGATATRAAAGLFNPLTGPRFTADGGPWEALVPFYRRLESVLGVSLVHPLPLVRPLAGSKLGPEDFPRRGTGWSAHWQTGPGGGEVLIEGGGWVDLDALLDAARARWLRTGTLEDRLFGPQEGRGSRVLWCTGPRGLQNEPWGGIPALQGAWQGVRGDVLTVSIPGLGLDHGEVASRFLLPLGGDRFRWGATHEIDVIDEGPRPAARRELEEALARRLGRPFEVIDHRWGVRPASRNRVPLVVSHPEEPGWTLVNGFGGRGVVQAPRVVAEWLNRVSS